MAGLSSCSVSGRLSSQEFLTSFFSGINCIFKKKDNREPLNLKLVEVLEGLVSALENY